MQSRILILLLYVSRVCCWGDLYDPCHVGGFTHYDHDPYEIVILLPEIILLSQNIKHETGIVKEQYAKRQRLGDMASDLELMKQFVTGWNIPQIPDSLNVDTYPHQTFQDFVAWYHFLEVARKGEHLYEESVNDLEMEFKSLQTHSSDSIMALLCKLQIYILKSGVTFRHKPHTYKNVVQGAPVNLDSALFRYMRDFTILHHLDLYLTRTISYFAILKEHKERELSRKLPQALGHLLEESGILHSSRWRPINETEPCDIYVQQHLKSYDSPRNGRQVARTLIAPVLREYGSSRYGMKKRRLVFYRDEFSFSFPGLPTQQQQMIIASSQRDVLIQAFHDTMRFVYFFDLARLGESLHQESNNNYEVEFENIVFGPNGLLVHACSIKNLLNEGYNFDIATNITSSIISDDMENIKYENSRHWRDFVLLANAFQYFLSQDI